MAETSLSWFDRVRFTLITGFGFGLVPVASGTFGTIPAVVLAVLEPGLARALGTSTAGADVAAACVSLDAMLAAPIRPRGYRPIERFPGIKVDVALAVESTLPAAEAAAAPGATVTVAGLHCESGDVLVRDAQLAEPEIGDVLVTPATGAYGHAMANNYNAALRPPVIFCDAGDARVVVRRENFEDLTARDVASP